MTKIVGLCLLIVSVLLSGCCTFAACGFGGGSRGDGWGSGGFSTGTTSTEVSYDALSSLALELNDRLASGEFGDVLKEVSCNIGVYSTVSGRDKYAIFYHYQASNYWYRNASGGLVYAYKDIDRISDLLGGNNGGIAYFLNRMEYVLTGSLLTAVNSINTATNSLLTTCNTISTKLDALTSVISNGKVLVDNSDVVSAIQSIPAFDDAELLSGLSALGATATRIADAIDYNFGQYSGTHTFPSLDKRQFYVYGDKAELFKDIPGKVLYSSSERLSTFSYTRDYDGMTRTLYVRAYPTYAQYSLELLSDTRPTAPITISKIEYSTLLGSPRYRDSIVYPVAWRYSSVANKYYAVTGFNVYYKDDPEQYPVSTSASAFENPYVYGFDSKPVDVVFSSRFTAFQQLENTRLINALSGRDYTSQLTAVVEKLDALANKSAVDLTTIESTLSTISDKLDNTASDVNNTIINITNDNDYFSVFYITDGDGNTQSVTDFAGALTGASGKLLSLLYRLVFADALGSVDGDLGNMEDFFTSEEPPPVTAAMDGDTAPANEVIDVWAS
ncbi:hypothetical protein [Dysosmobacter sp.]|uniref:hypothetical protein n=1 Tax=Dysosmobacter sp. TaxID=2591382 RepID=UPI003A922CA7